MIAIVVGFVFLLTLTIIVSCADGDAEDIFFIYVTLALLAAIAAVPALHWMQENHYRGLIEKGLGISRKSKRAWPKRWRSPRLLGGLLAAGLAAAYLAYLASSSGPATPPRKVPQPSAAPYGSAAPRVAPQRESIGAAIDAWARAWSKGDIDGYLAMYSPSFTPADGVARKEWENQRRRRFASVGAVEVDISDLAITPIGQAEAEATFVQYYSARQRRERSRKTLTLTLIGGQWKISAEYSRPIARNNKVAGAD